MVGSEGRAPLDPAETLRAVIALRDGNADPMIKRLYALANPRYKAGAVLRYIAEKEAFTFDILVHELKISKTTLYSIIRELELWAVIHKGYTIDMKAPGANPIMYVLAKADPSRVAVAHKTHLELKSKPKSEMDDNLRQLVSPIVDDVIGYVLGMHRDSSYGLPLKEVRRRYRESHGVFTDDVESAVFKVAKEKGWTLLVEV